jgi:uncharacterized RDD family membrane protein YckC
MKIDYKDLVKKKSDEELVKMVFVDRDGYQPLAIAAAEEEIKIRNLDLTQIDTLRTNLLDEQEVKTTIDKATPTKLVRFLNFVIDLFMVLILNSFLSYFIAYFVIIYEISLTTVHIYLMLAISYFSYYVFMETTLQKTIGKFITKTHVIMKDGSKPKTYDIFRRTFCRIIPLDGFSFLFDANGFHDKLSDTKVIKDKY